MWLCYLQINSFILSFPICIPFFFFFLALMHWLGQPMKHWSGECRCPCFPLHLQEKVLSPLQLRMLAAGLLWETLYQIEEGSFLFQVLQPFLSWITVGYCQLLFCIYWGTHMQVLLNLLVCWITLIDIWVLNQSYNLGINSILSWYIILYIYIFQSANILLRIFVSVFMRDVGLWFCFSCNSPLVCYSYHSRVAFMSLAKFSSIFWKSLFRLGILFS